MRLLCPPSCLLGMHFLGHWRSAYRDPAITAVSRLDDWAAMSKFQCGEPSALGSYCMGTRVGIVLHCSSDGHEMRLELSQVTSRFFPVDAVSSDSSARGRQLTCH